MNARHSQYTVPAQAQDTTRLEFRQHRFVPDHPTVPAHVKFRVTVKNHDDTADEFESVDLNRETLVAQAEHECFGDFHQDTAQGVMVTK